MALRLNMKKGVLVTRPLQAMPVLARPVLGHSIICKSAFAEELLPRAGKLSLTFPVNNYDDDSKVHNNEARPLSENKWKLTLACDACGVPKFQKMHALLLAMAMQETTHMDVRQRDATKDGDPKARNATIFNLSADLIEKSGYFGGGNFQVLTDNQWHMLNTKSDTDRDKGLIAAVGILMRAFEDWHIENTLAFVRSGGDGFDPNQTKDWREFVRRNNNHDDLLKDTEQYMSNIKTYLLYIDQNPSLFWDKYRPDILLKHK